MPRIRHAAFAVLITGYSAGFIRAADGPAETPANTALSATDIARLRVQLDQQQKQIDQLSAMLAAQRKLLDQALAGAAEPSHLSAGLGEIASTSPVLPAAPADAPRRPFEPQTPAAEAASPLQLKVGETTIMPLGFMDLTASWKDKNAGGSLGSSFGNVPFNNTSAAKLSEFRFSPQNSRLGFRVDGNWKGAHFLAYNEFDFVGNSAAGNLSVTNGGFVPRLRLFWVDVRKGQWEFLGGQSWSMLTPNRTGISALPGDLFYGQIVDINYLIGLPWTRQPGFRVLYHPSDKVTMGLSLENPNQYIGGSAGGPTVTLPSALASLAGTQLDNTANAQTTPNVHPDIIAKMAFDPNPRVHFEVAGIERTFKIWNPNTNRYFTKVGGGGSINGVFEVAKNLRFTTANYWSDGGGRYLFGAAPDLVLRSDGSISPIHSGGTIQGLEATLSKNWLLWAYWSGIYVGRNVSIDTNGSSPVGYGYTGSSNAHNRYVQELTFGFNQTLWKDSRYGALNLMAQYLYLLRAPWYVAAPGPKSAHDNTVLVNLRYSLPGSPPSFK